MWQCSGYASGSKYTRILNMLLGLNKPGFWIYLFQYFQFWSIIFFFEVPFPWNIKTALFWENIRNFSAFSFPKVYEIFLGWIFFSSLGLKSVGFHFREYKKSFPLGRYKKYFQSGYFRKTFWGLRLKSALCSYFSQDFPS